jgi:predicted phage tail protein
VTIDRLSSLSAQIAALRAEMSRKSGEARSAGMRTAEDVVKSSEAEQMAQRDPDALRKQLAEIVRGVSMEDAKALEQIRMRVVKAVLLWEFGREMREHEDWQPMVEKVAGALVLDDGFLSTFNRLVTELQT